MLNMFVVYVVLSVSRILKGFIVPLMASIISLITDSVIII